MKLRGCLRRRTTPASHYRGVYMKKTCLVCRFRSSTSRVLLDPEIRTCSSGSLNICSHWGSMTSHRPRTNASAWGCKKKKKNGNGRVLYGSLDATRRYIYFEVCVRVSSRRGITLTAVAPAGGCVLSI